MALSAREMQEAIIRNLRGKTGRDLEEWREIVRLHGPVESKLLIAWLKTEHGLGQITAQTISVNLNEGHNDYKDEAKLIDALFPRGTTSRTLYDSFDKSLTKSIQSVERVVCKTYVAYRAKTQIAAIRPAGLGVEVAAKWRQQSAEQAVAAGWKPTKFRGGGCLTHSQEINTKDVSRIVREIKQEVVDESKAT
jgi:hypothetical protein